MSKNVDVMTVVLELPENMEQRKAVTQALAIGSIFNGAYVTAASLEDEISINEALEQVVDLEIMESARRKAKAIHNESHSRVQQHSTGG